MIIPHQELNADTLYSILKEFVLREGTEYGAEDISVDDKIEQVKNQLQEGTAVLVYSELHETVNIIPADQFKAEQAQENE